ncbi:phosphoribulokinase [Amorphoplanes digitatis]|uniref:phosphoribulokinase n=1 Tax=Actinoplanes digitatis TaxID=1868 RepID=A0A7W7MS10_9ACTN|nr:phosphoribulokinase [Actinoplanes digitatis]MBB4764044.1 phosphoribulokinase [Actinoplanes digitatis]GID93864.1 phosphoribulokinase [Actinoplanes digitatis]
MTAARAAGGPVGARPVMLAVGGDSGSGKTTLARGLAEAIGPRRCTSICVDDYHRYDRAQRSALRLTALSPQANHLDIMEQHLQLLAIGQPILKPVYDHRRGTFARPEYLRPRPFVIVEGLFPLFSKLSRACFDVTVFVDPPEELRHRWKIRRDTTGRGYTEAEVRRELARREPDSAAYIRPQRRFADIVVRFAPAQDGSDPPGAPSTAELLLRPTVQHPPLASLLADGAGAAMDLGVVRDDDGNAVDRLRVHGRAAPEDARLPARALWEVVGRGREIPRGLGRLADGAHSEPLAITQEMLLFHLMQEVYQR